MVKPWAEDGYECWCLDIQHEPGEQKHDGILWIGEDIRTWKTPSVKYACVFAFPPCTHLAVSGARWWVGKGLRLLSESIELVARCAEICEEAEAPWMIENPVGSLSSYWRKPDAKFDPCDYAGYLNNRDTDAYTKKTCLWTGSGFNVPLPRPVFPILGSKMHMLPPSSDRARLRSETPMGFSRAVFEANRKEL